MNTHLLEHEILQNAVNACARGTGIKVDIKHGVKPGRPDRMIDAILDVQYHGVQVILKAEVRTRVTTVDALRPLVRATNEPEEYIIVAPQITVQMAELLRAGGIQFMDEAGNVYINRPPLYLFVKGNKNPDLTKLPKTGRAFNQTGVQLLFPLLCNKDLVNQPYRTIATQAAVAYGVVQLTMQELKELGFLEETGTRRSRKARLVKKEALVERWITGFAEQLRPKLVHGRYKGDAGWWNKAILDTETALWGGEVAAERLTGHLKPQDVIIYVDKHKPNDTLLKYRLRKDPLGEITLLHRFWDPDVIPANQDMVHPLLVYADLMATGEQRNLETARLIYEKYILRLVGED